MQMCLLDGGNPRFLPDQTACRIDLGHAAWLDLRPQWLKGQELLFHYLHEHMAWRSEQRAMYDRQVAVPRALATIPRDGQGHPILTNVIGFLSETYGHTLAAVAMALYRDGNDSVAWHGDKVLRDQPTSVMAILSLGEPRPFLLRPRGGGPSRVLSPGWGDLMVMGGTCQRLFDHSVPKVRDAGPRISIMFRDRYFE